MARYLLAVFAPTVPTRFGAYATREDMLSAFARTGEFNGEIEASGHLVFADGLGPPARAVTVDATGDAPTRRDGPYLTGPEHLGGFWVIEANDMAAACDIAERASAACGQRVEVRPFATEGDIEDLLSDAE